MVAEDIGYDTRHGGAWDRGTADSYYSRACIPHMYTGKTGASPRIEMSNMTAEDITAYSAGYSWNEYNGDKKDYGSSW